MRVPTYESKRAIPRGSGRQFSTVQISGAALAAPARALAERGEAAARFGRELTEFGLKRMQVGADNEAAEASAMLNVELQQLSSELLQTPNMADADKVYADKSRLIVDKFKSGLSGRMARDAFTRRARQIEFNSRIDFSRRNNERVVQQREVLLDRDTTTSIDTASNPLLTDSARGTALRNQLDAFNEAEADFGPLKTEKKRNKFFERLARSTLANTIQKGADINDTIEGFENGNSQDPILNAARDNLTQEQVNKLVKETVTTANSQRSIQDKEEKRSRELAVVNFEESVKTSFEELKVTADMASDETQENFAKNVDQMMQQTLDAFKGSDENRAQLRLELKKKRSKYALDFGEVRRKALGDRGLRVVNDDLKMFVADISRDPALLMQNMQLLNTAIDESAAEYISTEQEAATREAGEEDLIEAAIDTYFSRGQIEQARELFLTPGLQVKLGPTAQSKYRESFRRKDESDNAFKREVDQKIAVYEEQFGVKPTGIELKEILGLGGVAKEAINREDKYRKEYMAESKKFRVRASAIQRLRVTAVDGASSSDDIATIFAFMKLQDPTSAVLGGEVAMAENAGNISDKLWKQYNQFLGQGENLTNRQRKRFRETAENLFKSFQQEQLQLQSRYTQLVTGIVKDPSRVVFDYANQMVGLNRADESYLFGNLPGGRGASVSAPGAQRLPNPQKERRNRAGTSAPTDQAVSSPNVEFTIGADGSVTQTSR